MPAMPRAWPPCMQRTPSTIRSSPSRCTGAKQFGRASMTCLVENLFDCGEWAILEWRDPNGLRGCGFFHVQQGQIVFQRGYFDQLSFFRQQGLPVPDHYLG